MRTITTELPVVADRRSARLLPRVWKRHKYALLVPLDALLIFAAHLLSFALVAATPDGAAATAAHVPLAAGTQEVAGLAALVWLWVLQQHAVYRPKLFLVTDLDTFKLVVHSALVSLLVLLVPTLVSPDFRMMRLAFALGAAGSAAAILGLRYAVNVADRQLSRRGVGRRTAAVYGTTQAAVRLWDAVRRHPESGVEILGFVSANGLESLPEGQVLPVLGTWRGLEDLLRDGSVDDLIVADAALAHDRLLHVMSACERYGVELKMVPNTYDIIVDHQDLTQCSGVPLVSIRDAAPGGTYLLAKRLLDIVLASFFIVLLAPAWLVIAILVKRHDGGPIFFRQIRAGKDGVPFEMYKFRSMVVDAEERLRDLVALDTLSEPVFKLRDDPRVTRLGRWLRRTSLDETPQLLNVLRGDMSLVGPRPEELRLVQQYDVWQRRRLKATPGLTGLQQISNRGEPSLAERVKIDLVYLKKQDVLLDLYILVKTAYVVLRGNGVH
jgi:exopolysaccharide biosynthesis polyprenyl glycosylphosphotransferase